MPTPTYISGCTQLAKTCTGTCTGYASTCTCPPLIVIAVLATASASQSAIKLAGVNR